MSAAFLGTVGHMKAGFAAAPMVYTWFQQRFAGDPASTTCGTRSPVPLLR